MKHIHIIIATLLFTFASGKAQYNQHLSFAASYNQFKLGYTYKIAPIPLSIGVYAGVGNQDINNTFDDFLCGLQLSIPVVTFEKSDFYTGINTGMYFPNNQYYNANTFCVGANLGYEYFLGINKRHALFAEVGYVYGSKAYTQHYRNDVLEVSSTDVFKLSPIAISLGYQFKF
jgi:hypothetical protein